MYKKAFLLFLLSINYSYSQSEDSLSLNINGLSDTTIHSKTNNEELTSSVFKMGSLGGNIFSDSGFVNQNTKYNEPLLNKRKLAWAIGTSSAIWLGGMSFLQFDWYKDRQSVPFHFHNDLDGYLQMDKFGHIYGAYLESYIGYHWLRKAGVKRNKALIYGGMMGLVMQAPIEFWDGLHDGWGFSGWDMVANTLGCGLVVGNELLFHEQLVKYKLSFSVSDYSKPANGYLGTTIFSQFWRDYNSFTFWLSAPIAQITPFKKTPQWLNLAVGYSANGMYGMFKNITYYEGATIPPTERYRQYLLSLDIDWTRIPTRSKFMKGVLKGLTFIKLPFPALEFSQNKFKGHWLYY
ncbi:MAG: DUF2279 domain-containing protein [Pseudarcicella sp.]|nr:DUF2279 domain-containing protein [Pseudarcicella sp.]MBP6409949.1 DUF2279 domain-containing protein [Pseudarcicella sp.]